MSSTILPAGSSALIDVHGGAVDHDVGDIELAEVEQAAEAVALGLDDAALGVEQVDLAADLVGG